MDINLTQEQEAYLIAVGFPTFDEYQKNPEKWKGRDDDKLVQIDKGSMNLRRLIKEYKYQILGYTVDTLEKAEQIAKDHGWDIRNLGVEPNLEQTTGGKYICHTKIVLRDTGRQVIEEDQG